MGFLSLLSAWGSVELLFFFFFLWRGSVYPVSVCEFYFIWLGLPLKVKVRSKLNWMNWLVSWFWHFLKLIMSLCSTIVLLHYEQFFHFAATKMLVCQIVLTFHSIRHQSPLLHWLLEDKVIDYSLWNHTMPNCESELVKLKLFYWLIHLNENQLH